MASKGFKPTQHKQYGTVTLTQFQQQRINVGTLRDRITLIYRQGLANENGSIGVSYSDITLIENASCKIVAESNFQFLGVSPESERKPTHIIYIQPFPNINNYQLNQLYFQYTENNNAIGDTAVTFNYKPYEYTNIGQQKKLYEFKCSLLGQAEFEASFL